MTLLEVLRSFFQRHPETKQYYLALSGGVDSRVLLHTCYLLREEHAFDLHAIHVNHQINPQAVAWSDFCKQTCDDLSVPFSTHTIDLSLVDGDSLEEIARAKRYEVFQSLLQEGDVLLTAHHQEDQAETLLLQLFRGAGLKGLMAMPEIKPFAKAHHARPLLSVSKKEIIDFANEHHLRWVEDDSNSNVNLTRNFVRHSIIPVLYERWPTVSATLARSANHLAEAQFLLDEYASELLESVKTQDSKALSVSSLLNLSQAKQGLVLRAWINQQGFRLPSTVKLNTICSDVLLASQDSTPCVAWDDVEVRRFRGEVYLMKALTPHDPRQQYRWKLDETLNLPGVGTLDTSARKGAGLRHTDEWLTVQFRQGGETLALPGRGRHTLKNLFQEWGVPIWLRDRTPLIYVGETLVAVVGYYLNPSFKASPEEAGYEIALTEPATDSVK